MKKLEVSPTTKIDKLLDLYLNLPDDKRTELVNDIISMIGEEKITENALT